MRSRAFTLVELLAAIVGIGILAALLLPALVRSTQNSHRIACMNNQKQLAVAWQMYADQSSGVLASNDWSYRSPSVAESPLNSWVTGNAALDTNLTTITRGSLWPLAQNARVFHCPTDPSMVLGTAIPTLRSYSLSCYMGGPPEDIEYDVTPLTRTSQIHRPAATLTFLEEDLSTLDDGHFLYTTAVTNWLNVPAWRHQNGDQLTFADGHGEYWKWKSLLPAFTYYQLPIDLTNRVVQADIIRLQQTAPDAN